MTETKTSECSYTVKAQMSKHVTRSIWILAFHLRETTFFKRIHMGSQVGTETHSAPEIFQGDETK